MEWKDKYPKKSRPAYDELLAFFTPEIRELFLAFDREMRGRFGVHNKYHRFSNANGWVYGFGRSYSCELLVVTVRSDSFNALGVRVVDEASLGEALAKAASVYEDGFEERYANISEKRRAHQIELAKKRVRREKTEMESLTAGIDPEKFNRFSWSGKVSRSDLLRVYQSEAKGMLDEELLDEVGYTFYARCKQAKETRACMNRGQIICHHCGAVLDAGKTSPTGAVLVKIENRNAALTCACGYSYTYREYRRSCNAASMPGGRATPIFDNFIEKWPLCRSAREKMMLLDRLIHECHVTLMSGMSGRSVCVNLIEGTLGQISELIEKLAYE